MLNRAYKLSSNWSCFSDECERLQNVFQQLQYPEPLINSTISNYLNSVTCQEKQSKVSCTPSVRKVIPFKNQKAADIVRQQLLQLSLSIQKDIQPVFTSKSIGDELIKREKKPAIVSQHNFVYQFMCGLCSSNYFGYTCRHLHTRIDEHNLQSSSICRHLREDHGLSSLSLAVQDLNFKILKHCNNKFDYLIFKMLYIISTYNQISIFKAKLFT